MWKDIYNKQLSENGLLLTTYSIISGFPRLLSAKCKNALSSQTYVQGPQLCLSPITIATFHSQIFWSYFSFPSISTLNLIIWMCISFCLY